MVLLQAEKRGSDDCGSGEFGASRGSRKHNGIDYVAAPGQKVCSHVEGVVTKLGYPYVDDLSFRYVEITSNDRLKHRFFYVEPCVEVGDIIFECEVIGEAQNIAARYTNGHMKNHVHYEVKTRDGEYLNPENM